MSAVSRWFDTALRTLPEPGLGRGQSVCVGLSGGVDSAVAAALLTHRGYKVGAAYLHTWSQEEEVVEEARTRSRVKCSESDLRSAKEVARHLRIGDFEVYNGVSRYWSAVFLPFLEEYRRGGTPNPDLGCNRDIKFGLLAQKARDSGYDLFATGHYARLQKSEETNTVALLRGLDVNKDQSYFLASVREEALRRTLFPLGSLQKPQTRVIAKWLGLPNAERKSSKGMCFIGKRQMTHFLRQYIHGFPGQVRDVHGTLIGSHDGSLHFHSIGQRVAFGGMQQKLFVVDKKVSFEPISRCDLTVCPGGDNRMLFVDRMLACQPFWMVPRQQQPTETRTLQVYAKTCYNEKPLRCEATMIRDDSESLLVLQFPSPVRRTSPGQVLVLYDEYDRCMGGAWFIKDTWNSVQLIEGSKASGNVLKS